MVLAALLGALTVLGGLLALQRWRADDTGVETAQPASTTSAASEPHRSTGPAGEGPSTTAPTEASPPDDPVQDDAVPPEASEPGVDLEPVPCPPGVIPEICDAAEFVQRTRGRPFKAFPTVELLDDAAFDAALTRDLDEYRDELAEDDQVLTALGLLDEGVDLFRTYETFIEVGVVGFYRTDDGQLVVRGDELNLYGQLVLVHELVHALDDQWHELERDDFPNDDVDYAFSALVEGNARRVENLWRSQLSAPDQATLSLEELNAIPIEDLSRLLSTPQIVLDLELSAYVDGEVYVNDLFSRGGEDAIDAAFADPPDSSEQVLHPGLAGRPEVEVVELVPPAGDGPVVSEGSLGELLLRSWLGDAAARGWGGDAYALWESDRGTCITVDVAADTAADLAETDDAAGRWADRRPDVRSVERIETASRSLLRITGC